MAPSLQRVVDGIYDAAPDPALWTDVIHDVAAYCRASFALLSWRDRERAEGALALRVETGHHEQVDDYFRNFITTDPIVNIVKAPLDVPQINETWEPRREFLTSERYKRFHRPLNIDDRACVLILPNVNWKNATLTVSRNRRMERFDRRSLRPLQELSPHIRRSLQMTRRLRRQEADAASLTATLDRSEDGVFLVDRTGRIVFHNVAAQGLVARGVLAIRAGRLSAGRLCGGGAGPTAALVALVQRVIRTGEGAATDPGGTLALHTEAGAVRATLSVSPLRTEHVGERFGPQPVRAAVFVREAGAAVALSPEKLRGLYGLTPAESRLALALAEGQRLQDVADAHGLGKATVRTQLLSVFGKTGVSRQADLVRTLLAVPGGRSDGNADGHADGRADRRWTH